MSAEELKIRKELEMDVERDLEAEIKDGIYHLALRLHRLYQHQKKKTPDFFCNVTHDTIYLYWINLYLAFYYQLLS